MDSAKLLKTYWETVILINKEACWIYYLMYSASLFVMSCSFKGLGNKATPSAVLAACSHTATQAKTNPKS